MIGFIIGSTIYLLGLAITFFILYSFDHIKEKSKVYGLPYKYDYRRSITESLNNLDFEGPTSFSLVLFWPLGLPVLGIAILITINNMRNKKDLDNYSANVIKIKEEIKKIKEISLEQYNIELSDIEAYNIFKKD